MVALCRTREGFLGCGNGAGLGYGTPSYDFTFLRPDAFVLRTLYAERYANIYRRINVQMLLRTAGTPQ